MIKFSLKRIFDRVNIKSWLLPWLYRHFLQHIPFPKYRVDEILAEYSDCIIAYVHRYKSDLLHYSLERKIAENKLVKIDVSAFNSLSCVDEFIHHISSQTKVVEFFLKMPKTAVANQLQQNNFVQNLIELQKKIKRPIILVPHTLLLGSRPHQKQPSANDMFFGTWQEPGSLRLLLRVLLCHRWANWEIAETVNLQKVIEQHPEETEFALAKQVRWLLIKNLNNIERAYFGPPLKSHARICKDTLRDKNLQSYIDNINSKTGVPKSKLEKKASKYYQEIAARFDIDFIRIMNVILSFFWRKTSGGLVWFQKDMENIKKASQKGPLIIVPAHKSHLDYVVISQILYTEGLMLPHVAAGANLSFFPFGPLARRGGAFFIRRSFKGDPLYPQVVKAYVKRLLKDSFTQEFFIEGGRSRTGKTLSPKLGFLSIIVDCLTQGKPQEAMFLPASISYEKLVEGKSYQHELTGGEKKQESAKDLLSSTKILKKKYGRIFISFDEPISFLEFMNEKNNEAHNYDEKKNNADIVKSLAHRLVYGMNNCAIITPSSLIAVALFGSMRRALSYPRLIWHIRKIVHYIRDNNLNARFSDEFSKDFRRPIDTALELLCDDKLLTKEKAGRVTYYRIHKTSALSVDYYKNNIIQYFVSDAIIATAFLALSEKNRRRQVLKNELEKYTQILSQIFKFEFVYPVGKPFKQLFEERLQKAFGAKIFQEQGDFITLSPAIESIAQIQFAARLLANFIDAYWVCFQKIVPGISNVQSHKALIAILLEHLKSAYISGVSDCPEIVSKSLVENVLAYFTDIQAIKWRQGKPVLGEKKYLDKIKIAKMVLEKAHFNR